MNCKGELSVAKWDEANLGKVVNKMMIARASIIYKIAGAINGECAVEYLLHYTNYDIDDQHRSEATYTGYIVFSGSINGKLGTFVLTDNGQYSPVGPVSELSIKANTGTEDFTGISGTGKIYADGEKMIIEIEYQNE